MGQPHESKGGFLAQPQGPRLLDRVREAIRCRHYSRRTEKATVSGTVVFIGAYRRSSAAESSSWFNPRVSAFIYGSILLLLAVLASWRFNFSCRFSCPSFVSFVSFVSQL